jgi:hypothetical protein
VESLPVTVLLEGPLPHELLPHQWEEERALRAAAAQRMSEPGAVAPLIRMHAAMEAPFALETLLRVHLVAEEEVLAGFLTVSRKGHAP